MYRQAPLCFVLGTRPEVIKMWPLIRACKKKSIPYFIIDSGQHYDFEMKSLFLQELKLGTIKYLPQQAGQKVFHHSTFVERIKQIAITEDIRCVCIHGDTDTAFIGAKAFKELGIPIAHIESGLRNYDLSMPEEKNRISIDHMSDFLFAVTNVQKINLINEGISSEKIFTVGNTIVDATNLITKRLSNKNITQLFPNLTHKNYFLLTLHRQNNIDDIGNLKKAIKSLSKIGKEHKKTIVWPVHPRAQKSIDLNNIEIPPNILLFEPQGYYNFLALIKSSLIVFTDSGGVQEESCILQTPCITLRESTERPETIEIGSNTLCGLDVKSIRDAIENYLQRNLSWECPLGDGQSASRILEILNHET